MALTWIDGLVFAGFLLTVIVVSLYASRQERTSQDYFLAGRQLGWVLIGFSLVASNISTEHFVGMAGAAFGKFGLAIAAYEWMASIMLVFVAWWFLPRFLSAGIYTMPEYLEYRFDAGTRTIMAVLLLFAYVLVFLATVIYSGALALNTVFDLPSWFQSSFDLTEEKADQWALITGIWVIGVVAGSYTIYGGLKAVVWSDLIQGIALLLGAALVAWLGLSALGNGDVIAGWTSFAIHNEEKLHTILPWNHPDLPWIAVFVGGLWIPNLFYWGLNQFITQRTLAAKNLAEGQKGIFFAALLKLSIPFIIVLPGIMAFQLYGDQIENGDAAYPFMISELLPPWLRGIMFAALTGAVMSSFNSGVNSASTIFTLDLFKRYISPMSSQESLVFIGRWATAIIVVLACLWAPVISSFDGVFQYIQEIWGFITPGIVVAFLGGMIFKHAPALAAKTVMLTGIGLYAIFRIPGWVLTSRLQSFQTAGSEISPPEGWLGAVYQFSTITFLHHMFIIFWVLAIIFVIISKRQPLSEAVEMPRSSINIEPHPREKLYGGIIIALTTLCFVIFW